MHMSISGINRERGGDVGGGGGGSGTGTPSGSGLGAGSTATSTSSASASAALEKAARLLRETVQPPHPFLRVPEVPAHRRGPRQVPPQRPDPDPRVMVRPSIGSKGRYG